MVLIVGGGISGLTVAHELARHSQFDVTVIERNQVLGGKARSIRHPDDNVGEHAMRVYLASYSTLFQTKEEISFGSSNAYENLVYEDFSMRLRGQDVVLSSQYVSFFQHVRDAFRIAQFLRRTGLSIFEIIFFLYKTGRLLRMSDARVAHELAGISFTQYMDPQGRRSQAFRDVIFVFPEVVVAAKRTSSAAVVTRMLLEWFVGPFLRSNYRRLGFASLNGPTSEHFIDPWVAHLQQQGVHFILDKRVTQILHSGPDVTGLETSDGQVLTADLYVMAVQHNILHALLTPALKALLPSLANLDPLAEEWSNGVQYFLNQVPAHWEQYVGRSMITLDSPWSIVFMIQTNRGPWQNVSLPAGVEGVLSAVMSNVANPGNV